MTAVSAMRPCCEAIDAHFSMKKAEDLQEDLRKSGPPAETRLLVKALKSAGVSGMALLDVGAGIGVLAEQLLEAGAHSAVLVDISSASLAVAASRLLQPAMSERVQFRQGDIIELSPELDDADIVTLDKVICCYPDAAALVTRSTAKTRRYYAASYPRDRWLIRLSIWFENLTRRLKGNPFRAYVHPVASIEALIRQNGFDVQSVEQTFFWRCALFVRAGRAVVTEG